jgi:hypothetical protein
VVSEDVKCYGLAVRFRRLDLTAQRISMCCAVRLWQSHSTANEFTHARSNDIALMQGLLARARHDV